MKTVGYTSHLVPPEWIEAHGLQPLRVRPGGSPRGSAVAEGLCPFVTALVRDLSAPGCELDAFVFTTSCDQMRRAPSLVRGGPELFLLNTPATWTTETARRFHLAELERLGRFLVGLGGRRPTDERLWATMQAAEARRAARGAGRPRTGTGGAAAARRILLAGGPLTEADTGLYADIEAAGGRVVADLTETGPDLRVPPFGPPGGRDALSVLSGTYFDGLPAVHHRPGTRLMDYLVEGVRRADAEGVLLVHHTWCDLWIGAAAQLREVWARPVRVLELGEGEGERPRQQTRIEAFLESLR